MNKVHEGDVPATEVKVSRVLGCLKHRPKTEQRALCGTPKGHVTATGDGARCARQQEKGGGGWHEQLVSPCARVGACCRKRIDMHKWVCRCNRQGQDQFRG